MEFVLVVKRYDLFDLSFPHGFVAGADDERVALWTARIRDKGFFLERRQAERDSSFKQVIPYVVVTHADEVLLLERLAGGGEARLHGKRSIGVGGHVNPIDDLAPGDDLLEAGCRRELEEELHLGAPYDLSPVGAINDESGDVGSVHFGLVYRARLSGNDVSVRETDTLAGSFVAVGALRELATREPGRFETWSRLIVERLDAVLG